MPPPSQAAFQEQTGRVIVGTDETGSSIPAALAVRNLKIIHELGIDLQAEQQEVSVDVQPSNVTTRVVVTSEVRTEGAQKLRSAQYMATVRRRETTTLARTVLELAENAKRQDFGVFTFPLTERIKKLLATLSTADEEGNTREILRRVRDTLLNGGWDSYRKPEVRSVVSSIFLDLSQLEEVQPGHVKAASVKIASVGADHMAHLFDIGNDNDQPNDSE